LKFLIYDVEDIKKNDVGAIDVLNLRTSNSFDGYKFSILLSDNDWSVVDSPVGNNIGVLTQSQNLMTWKIFDEWKMDKNYNNGDIVILDDILYQSTSDNNITTSPTKVYIGFDKSISAPYNQSDWIYYAPSGNIFWNPEASYPLEYLIYNKGDYYYNAGGSDDFWSPKKSNTTGYAANEIVLFNGSYYMSMTSSNHARPDYKSPVILNSKWNYYWVATQSSSPKWLQVQMWNPSLSYVDALVVHNDIVYHTMLSQTGNEPGVSNDWLRQYSLAPDTTIAYNSSNNPIIEMNNGFYMIDTNASNSTLENGINIYINKKWKNILINIDIADNTIPNLSEADRDILYNELNSKLTAYNFVQCINNITNKYGFTDYINYIIINEDGSIKRYNYNNIEGLPYYIACEKPDEVIMKHNSLLYTGVARPKELKLTKNLKSISDNLSNLNYYNGVSIAAEINANKDTPKPIANLHGSRNITEELIYRFSGSYMPIFYDIQLFDKNFYTASVGNYKFDTTLTEFGLIKERKIRKVNHKGSVLKLDNVKDQKSIYPMVEEFGYTTVNSFIFKSSWDLGYHYLTSNNPNVITALQSKETMIKNPGLIGIQTPIQNISL
jgi:hypothetical protein